MAKSDKLEWFGADTETSDGGKTVHAAFDGKTTPEGRAHRVKTSARDARIAELTARYKLLRGMAEFAPPDDKETMERRRDIAFHEMQAERFRQKLERYQDREGENARPEQVALLKQHIAMYVGMVAELTGQGA